MLSEIFKIVAKKHNKSPEQIEHIYKSTINEIRFYLDHPTFSKTTIRIPEFGSFKITRKSVSTFRDGIFVDYYNQFKNTKNKTHYYARKKRKQKDNNGHDEG